MKRASTAAQNFLFGAIQNGISAIEGVEKMTSALSQYGVGETPAVTMLLKRAKTLAKLLEGAAENPKAAAADITTLSAIVRRIDTLLTESKGVYTLLLPQVIEAAQRRAQSKSADRAA